MKLWQAPARPLPVTVRPIAGETLPSYCRRLAAANDLTPYAVLRALGHLRTGPGKHLLACDARMNEQAAARLAAYTAIPTERLARALPAVNKRLHPMSSEPPGRPALCFERAQTRPPCRECELAASGPDGPAALVLPGWTPFVCHRHRRWLGPASEPAQRDLSAAPDIIAADRRLARILARSGDRTWARNELHVAWNITRDWADPAGQRMPALAQRWHDRAAALGVPALVPTSAGRRASWIVAFPEAVAITAVLTDLDLRREIALGWDDRPLYRRLSPAVGEPRYQAWAYQNAPVRGWIRVHRYRFEQLRNGTRGKPIPPPERFK